jgi:antitoxin VapB
MRAPRCVARENAGNALGRKHLERGWISRYFRELFEYLRGPMPLYIRDDATAALVAKLAKLRGMTKQDAVRLAVQAELDRTAEAIPLQQRLEALWRDNPLPPATGQFADKAFFDELWGER